MTQNTIPIRRKQATGAQPGRLVLTINDTMDAFEVSDWSLSSDNQTLSMWFADGHQEHVLLGAGDRYAFWPA